MDNRLTERYCSIKEGDMFAFSSGQYSDYDCSGFSVAKKSFDMFQVSALWEKECKPYGKDPKHIANKYIEIFSTCIEFVPWLEKNGYIKLLEYKEFHLGSYGNFSLQDK